MTLVEMLVVLAVVGVSAGVVVLGLGSLRRGDGAQAEANRLADRLKLAADEVLVSGNPAHGRDFTCYYFSAGELIAADCVNRPADFVTAKRAIAQRAPIVRSELIGAAP